MANTRGKIEQAHEEAERLVEDGFVEVSEAAKFLGLSRSKLYLLMDAGDVVYARFGRSRRIPRRALREYAERCLVGACAGDAG